MTRDIPGGRTERGARAPSRERVDEAAALRFRARGALAIVALPSRADADGIRALLRHCERALVAGSRAIAVDLSATDRVDTRTLGELGAALRRISRHEVAVTVVGADPRIRRVLELCEIDGLGFHQSIRGARANARALPARAIRLPWRDALRRRPETDGLS